VSPNGATAPSLERENALIHCRTISSHWTRFARARWEFRLAAFSHRLQSLSVEQKLAVFRVSLPCTADSIFQIYKPLYRCFPDAPVVSISHSQRLPLPSANWIANIYHGLPSSLYKPSFRLGRLSGVFLGRISPEKRPDRAYQDCPWFGNEA